MIKLFNRSFIVLSYVVFVTAKLCYSIFASMESGQLLLMRCITVIVVVALAFGVFKDMRVCRIILALIIAITGVSGVMISIFVGMDQVLLKVGFLILSIYFIIGGFMMLRRD